MKNQLGMTDVRIMEIIDDVERERSAGKNFKAWPKKLKEKMLTKSRHVERADDIRAMAVAMAIMDNRL